MRGTLQGCFGNQACCRGAGEEAQQDRVQGEGRKGDLFLLSAPAFEV